MSKVVEKNKMEFLNSFTPIIQDKVLMNTTEHIFPYSFNLIHIKEVTFLFQLFLLFIRLGEFFICCIGDTGLFWEFNTLHGEPRDLSNEFLSKLHCNFMESNSIINPIFEKGSSNMGLGAMHPLQIANHLPILKDPPHILTSLLVITFLGLLFSWLTSHIAD